MPSVTAAESQVIDPLVRLSRSGDRAAFGRLVRLHYSRTMGICYRILFDWDAAEDATQEVFVKAWTKLGEFRGESRFETWLHAITVRHCLDLRRRKARTGQREAPFAPEFLDEQLPRLMAINPALAASKRDLYLVLQEAVSRLPEDQGTVLTLFYYGDHPMKEIAQTLGLPVRTANYRLHAALRRLKEELEGMGT
jgi:RNA polymerase sigma-70 factor (ECF subfamily)